VPAGFRSQKLRRAFSVDRFRTPGIAVDPEGGRAFVAWADDEIAEVDLTSLDLRYQSLSQPVSLLGRLHDWLEPSAQAKGATDGSLRRVLWLGNGLLAVTGSDEHAFIDAAGQQQQRTESAGMAFVDTGDWSKRILDPQATSAIRAGNLVLAFGSRWNSETGGFDGAGLTAYDREGKRLFHLFDQEAVGVVEAWGQFAYLSVDDSYVCRHATIDLRAGTILRELHTDPAWPTLLVRSSG
jgi:hypothetical protein